MDEVDFYLEDLKSKFDKINPKEYYLSYSGGRDSHLLYWFIKDYLKDTDIEIVSSLTPFEHIEIRDRILNNADTILHPTKKPYEIKEQYGIPCFTKMQDQFIYEYRKNLEKGIKDEDMPNYIHLYIFRDVNYSPKKLGRLPYAALPNRAYDLLFSGKLHKVSKYCCSFMKKEPAKIYDKKTGKKPILGIMSGESIYRSNMITTCFNKVGHFYPIHDLTRELRNEIEKKYEIQVPSVYEHVNQTGCAGCPYGIRLRGNNEGVKKEIELLSENKKKFVLDYFYESYRAKNFNYFFDDKTDILDEIHGQ